MNRTIELPERVYRALRHAAAASGLTPAAWIAARIGSPTAAETEFPTRTLAEQFAGRVGQIASGGKESLSEDAGQAFTEYLEVKRNAGHL